MNVLIVDDKKENLYLMERILQKLGYESETAENGKEALEKLQNNNFEMIISDILMPVMDGFQLCKAVKKDKDLGDLLFIFYTATYTEEEDEKFALSLGADKFLRKPLESEIFVEIIQEIVQSTELLKKKRRKIVDNEEKEIFNLYNERLINKLEKKVSDLEEEVTRREKSEKALIESEKKHISASNQAELYKDLLDHDINNILQIIFSGIQLFQESQNEPRKQALTAEIIDMILIQIRRAERLVSTVRKLFQLDKEEIPVENLVLFPIIEKVVSSSKKSYIDRDLDINIEQFDKNLRIQANFFLEEVFLNFIDNAITHNNNAEIKIVIRVTIEQIESIKYVKIEFIDNGIGIEDSRKKEIFYRQDFEYSTGLGLSLVKRIVDSFNGNVWVENRVPKGHTKGSNFILVIPQTREM